MPNSPGYARFCDEIVEQTRLLRTALAAGDLDATVPTCPDWTLRRLAEHLGGAHRFAAVTVRTRAAEPPPEDAVPAFRGPGGDLEHATSEQVDAWLAEGAALLSDALRETDPDTPMWTWFTDRRAAFIARRMAHETAVHRADVSLTTGTPYVLAPELAVDALDEWLEIVTSAVARSWKPELAVLDERAGDTLHLHATDTGGTALPGGPAEWVVVFRKDGLAWRRAHEKSTTALRGPLTDVLLAFLHRLPVQGGGLEVLGDKSLLERWQRQVTF